MIATVDGTADYLYCFDANGNIGQVVSAADGAIAARYEYDPYGKPIKAEGAYAGENPFRFSTKYHDDETGLVYYGYRYYSAGLGRWMNRDSISENGSINLYLFVRNNSISLSDKLGLLVKMTDEEMDNIYFNDDMKSYATELTPLDIVRMLYSLPFNFLSGDFFRGKIEDHYQSPGCDFLLTVTGMLTDYNGNITFNKDVSNIPKFKDSSTNYVYNPKRWGGLGDLMQVIGNELGAIDTIAQRVADKIINAANVAQDRHCGDCFNIYIVAHSQGTMAVKRAFSILPTEIKKHIEFWGVGGEIAISDPDAKINNYANSSDWVPLANLLPTRLIDNYGSELREFDSGISPWHPLNAHSASGYVDFLMEIIK